MQVCVFGAGGYVGSRLVDWLLTHSEAMVVGTDIEHARVAHLFAEPRFTYYSSDVRLDRDLTFRLVMASDVVVNTVGAGGPVARAIDPLQAFELEFAESVRLVEHCAHSGRRLVQLTGGEIYGDHWLRCLKAASAPYPPSNVEPVREQDAPLALGPVQELRWLHAACRQLLERVIVAYGVSRGLSYTVVRPFNVLGVRSDRPACEMPFGTADILAQLIDDAYHGRVPDVEEADAEPRYTFVDADDVAECIGRVVLEPNQGGGEIFNVGHPQNQATLPGLARMVHDVVAARRGSRQPESGETGVESKTLELSADLSYVTPDIGHAEDQLGWRPSVSLDQIVSGAVDRFMLAHRGHLTAVLTD